MENQNTYTHEVSLEVEASTEVGSLDKVPGLEWRWLKDRWMLCLVGRPISLHSLSLDRVSRKVKLSFCNHWESEASVFLQITIVREDQPESKSEHPFATQGFIAIHPHT
jgi:hypothetical protein